MERQTCAICHRNKELDAFRLGVRGKHKKICAACEDKLLKKAGITRRCHDCGRPTNNYRCAACWRKLREDDVGGIDPQYLP